MAADGGMAAAGVAGVTATRDGQRRAFTTVLAVELWERFGYYGVQSLLLLFMVERLALPDRTATLLLGAFSALTYAMPAIGGWIGDKVLGTRRTAALGAAVLAGGYALLSAPGGNGLLLVAMAVIATGNGLFKPNAANLVRRIFEGDASRLDSAFTLYYMAVNVGSTVSILLCPILKDRFGWRSAFAVCCLGLLLGLAQFVMLRRRLDGVGSAPDRRPVRAATAGALGVGIVVAIGAILAVLRDASLARDAVWLAGGCIVAIWAWLYRSGGTHERRGLAILYVLIAETMLFFVFYQQMATSLTLFALRDVDLRCRLFGATLFVWSPAQFQALDPIFIMVLSPILAVAYAKAGARGRDLHVATKFAIGFALTASAFLVWWRAAASADGTPVSSFVMVAGYGLLSAGELLVSGLGLAVVARYVPSRAGGFMMGSYFVAVGIAMYAGSAVASLVGGGTGVSSAAAYASLFERLFVMGGASTVVAAVAVPFVRALERGRRADPGPAIGDIPYGTA